MSPDDMGVPPGDGMDIDDKEDDDELGEISVEDESF